MHWFNSYLKLLNVNDRGGDKITYISSLTGLTLYWFYIPRVKPFAGRKSWHLVGGTLKISWISRVFWFTKIRPHQPGSESSHIPCHPHAGLRPLLRPSASPSFFSEIPALPNLGSFVVEKNLALQRWIVLSKICCEKDVRLGDFGERNISWYWRCFGWHFF